MFPGIHGGSNAGASNADSKDRRASQRFPLQLAVRYRILGSKPPAQWTVAESINISSTGILFKVSEEVEPGQGVEAYVAWPIPLDNRVPLKLAIKGPVVRCDGQQAAVRFERYEFKTRSSETTSV
jgi:hypothetical protein